MANSSQILFMKIKDNNIRPLYDLNDEPGRVAKLTGYQSACSSASGLLIIVSLAIFAINCGSKSQVPSWEQCTQPSRRTVRDKVAVSDHLVIYIDTSASMGGFVNEKHVSSQTVSQDMQTIFSKTLLELRTAATSLNQQTQIVIKEVSSTVSSPSFGDLAITKASLQQSIYKGAETDLAAAIQTFSIPIDEPKNPNPAMLHILVTDGIQSTKNDNQATNCTTGSDWFCVRKKIKELIENGWGGTILGIRSEFNGIIFSEINKTKIPYSTDKDVKKFRPFYLYIFSPNPQTHQELVNILKKKLNQIAAENNLDKKDIFREYPLTPELVSGQISSSFNVAENSNLLQIKQADIEQPQFDVLVDTQTESKGYKTFTIKLTLPWSEQTTDTESLEDLIKLIKWELEPVPTKENEKFRYPDLVLSKEPTMTNNEVLVDFETGWKKGIGKKGWRLYQLVGRLDNEKIPSWVTKWSTNLDTTSAMGNRTLNLESSLATLWNNKSVDEYVVTKVCLRVGEK